MLSAESGYVMAWMGPSRLAERVCGMGWSHALVNGCDSADLLYFTQYPVAAIDKSSRNQSR